jgi:hypothetical protein
MSFYDGTFSAGSGISVSEQLEFSTIVPQQELLHP